MFWFINRGKRANEALMKTQGLLNTFPVEDLNLDALTKELRKRRITIANIGPFAISLREDAIVGTIYKSGLGKFLTPAEPRYRFSIVVSTVHAGDYCDYQIPRAEKSFDTLPDVMKWLVGR